MAKVIDISSKLTSERPKLKLAEGKEFEIDNRKNTVLIVEEKLRSTNLEEIRQVDEVLELLLGKDAVKEINKMDLTFADYQTIFIAVMAGASNEDFEVVEARFRESTKKA